MISFKLRTFSTAKDVLDTYPVGCRVGPKVGVCVVVQRDIPPLMAVEPGLTLLIEVSRLSHLRAEFCRWLSVQCGPNFT
jgi:hypothetical protein